LPLDVRREWINNGDDILSLNEQMDLSSVSKSAYYYSPVPETYENLLLMEEIDRIFTDHPYYGSRRMTAVLLKMGHRVNRKRIIRLMDKIGIEAIYPRRNLSKANEEGKSIRTCSVKLL
jgi:putative transposase